MKYKIKELNEIMNGIMSLIDIKTTTKLKFKILKNFKKLDEILEIARNTIDGQTEEEVKNFLETEQEVQLDLIEIEEIQNLDISARTLLLLEKIIKETENE